MRGERVIAAGRHFALAIVVALTAGTGAADAATVSLDVEGRRVALTLSGPQDADRAILLVHDWFGMSDLVAALADRWVAQGYRVAAVDLYGRPGATDHAGANQRMNAYFQRPDAERQADLGAAIERLAETADHVAVVGFSMGGNVALGASVAHPDLVDATVIVYGWGLERTDDKALARLEGPILLVTGGNDRLATASNLTVTPRLVALQKSVELLLLRDLRHAYLQPLFNGGANLDEAGGERTLDAIDRFLDDAF